LRTEVTVKPHRVFGKIGKRTVQLFPIFVLHVRCVKNGHSGGKIEKHTESFYVVVYVGIRRPQKEVAPIKTA